MKKFGLLFFALVLSLAAQSQDARGVEFVENQLDVLDLMTTSHLSPDSLGKRITELKISAEKSESAVMLSLIDALEKFNNNEPTEALKISYELLYLGTSSTRMDSISIYQNIGAIFNSLNETEIAIRNIELAIELRKREGLDVQTLANWLMAIYYYSGEIEESIHAVKTNLSGNDPIENLNAFINLGIRYSELKDQTDSAIHYLKMALNVAPESLVVDDYMFIYVGLGNAFLNRNNNDSALYYFKATIADTVGMGNWYPYTMANQKIAQIYLENQEKDSALAYLENFFLCPCLGNETNAWLHQEKAKAYKELGSMPQYFAELEIAHDFLKKHLEEIQEQDRLVSGINSSSLKLIEENVQSLDQKNKAYAQKNTTFLGLLITLGVLLVTLVLFFVFRSKKEKQIFEIQRSLNLARLEQAELEKAQMKEKVKYQNIDLSHMASSMALKKDILEQQVEKLTSILGEEDKSEKLKAHVRELKGIVNIDDNVTLLRGSFDSANTMFLEKIKEAYPQLTKNDLEICSLHLLGLSSKEIATIRGISPKAVQITRYRLKKKMDLDENVSFLDHLKTFAQ